MFLDEKKMFCEICSKTDIQKLNHQIPMTYDDFERITYILDILKFHRYGLEFWNTFQERFEQELEESQQEYFDIDADVERYTKWLVDFTGQISEPLLKHLVKVALELEDI